MSFKLVKPATVPARGQQLLQPVEKLNIAMNLLSRVQGDELQSAVRLGELVELGILQVGPGGVLLPGTALSATAATPTFKNLLINGDFFWWQRGTGGLAAGTGTRYGSDRWAVNSGTSTITASRQSFALGQTDVPGNPFYYHRSVVAAGAGVNDFAVLMQRIENVPETSGEVVTLSFWAKADAPRNISVEFYQDFGSGGSSPVNAIGVQKIALTTAWQKVVVTASLPSVAGKTFGSNNNLTVLFWLDGGSNFNSRNGNLGHQSGTFDIATVQLERGKKATTFEKLPYETSRVLCQRYYQVIGAVGTNSVGLVAFTDATYVGQGFYQTVMFPTSMRGAPTVTLGTFALANTNQPTVLGASANSLTLVITPLAAGRAAARSDVASPAISLDSEL